MCKMYQMKQRIPISKLVFWVSFFAFSCIIDTERQLFFHVKVFLMMSSHFLKILLVILHNVLVLKLCNNLSAFRKGIYENNTTSSAGGTLCVYSKGICSGQCTAILHKRDRIYRQAPACKRLPEQLLRLYVSLQPDRYGVCQIQGKGSDRKQ